MSNRACCLLIPTQDLRAASTALGRAFTLLLILAGAKPALVRIPFTPLIATRTAPSPGQDHDAVDASSQIFRFTEINLTSPQITCIIPPSCPTRGASRESSRTLGQVAVDAMMLARLWRVTSCIRCVRRSRVVLTPQGRRQVPGKLALLGSDGVKPNPWSPGRAR